VRVKLGWLLSVCSLCLLAQGWGRREAMRPWLQAKFSEAEQTFAELRSPAFPQAFLWEAEFETERARFGQAAALIKEAKRVETTDSRGLSEHRLARLNLSVGRFAEAQQTALNGRKWDGADVRKLAVNSAMDLVTIGEVFLAKGRFPEAKAILSKALNAAKNVSSIDGLEWVRAQNDIAVADLNLGLLPAALQDAELALSAAERQWGAASIPAMDVQDTLGLVRLHETRFGDAEILLSQSRLRREALYGKSHPKVAASYLHAALLSAAQNHIGEAVRLTRISLEIENSLAAGSFNGRRALVLLSAAEVFQAAGQNQDADDCYRSALPVLEKELGTDVPRVMEARKGHPN
jgi:tetratricopeptide (TPR) repeat protein